MKNWFKSMFVMLFGMMLVAGFTACGGGGGDDDDDNSGVIDNGGGGNGGGGSSTSTFSIIGTWRYYFQSNDPSRGEVYNLVTFKSDKTGALIEEVGYGSDNPNYFTWTQSDDIIRITFVSSDYSVTWKILQVIDNDTVIVSDGKNQYTVYRNGTQGGGGGNEEPSEDYNLDLGRDDYGSDTNLNNK